MVQRSVALSFVYATNVADKSTHMSNGFESARRVGAEDLSGNGAFANCVSFGNVKHLSIRLFIVLLFLLTYFHSDLHSDFMLFFGMPLWQ